MKQIYLFYAAKVQTIFQPRNTFVHLLFIFCHIVDFHQFGTHLLRTLLITLSPETAQVKTAFY